MALAAALLSGCAGKGASRPGEGLFRGDRVTVERDFIYLDDAVFLQSPSAYGHRGPGTFSFRLPVYFNARPGDTLRLGADAARVRPARGDDSISPAPFPCMLETSGNPGKRPDSSAIAARLADTSRVFTLVPRPGLESRVDLGLHCLDYHPLRGRTDTLELSIGWPSGSVSMALPFHVSYRGPVVSILLGTGLLLFFTQLGWWIASER